MPIDSVSSSKPSRRSASNSRAQGAMRRPLRLEIAGRLGQAPSGRARPGAASAATARAAAATSAGAKPDLLASPLMLTCRQTESGARCGRPLRAQALGGADPVDRVHPIEMLGDLPGLVALQRPDEVPLELAARSASAAIFSSASCT